MLIITGSIGGAPFYEQNDLRNPLDSKPVVSLFIKDKQKIIIFVTVAAARIFSNSKIPFRKKVVYNDLFTLSIYKWSL